jgi:hypothetical protein
MKLGNHNLFNDLTNEQVRQTIDARQCYAQWQAASYEQNIRYRGSMVWRRGQNGAEYLCRRIGRTERGMGPRSVSTEAIKVAFDDGQRQNKDRLDALKSRLMSMAPVNKALMLGRVPIMTAKILRRLAEYDLLGRQIVVAGTNALFAYEAQAGVYFDSGIVSTADIDLLYDARLKVTLFSEDPHRDGLIGILRRIDSSFSLISKSSFTASNNNGFMVDLITPTGKNRIFSSAPKISRSDGDLIPVEIDGLGWLVNSPKFKTMAIAEDGYPVPFVVPDPRYFAVHKAWLAGRQDRDILKKKRDLAQAIAITDLTHERFPELSFSGRDMEAIPSQYLENLKKISGHTSERKMNDLGDFPL